MSVMSMDKQMKSRYKCSLFPFRKYIAKINRFIYFRHCQTLVHFFLTSKIAVKTYSLAKATSDSKTSIYPNLNCPTTDMNTQI